VPARFDGGRIDVLPQIDDRRLDAVEPSVPSGAVLVQTIQASIDLVEALIDPVQALIDAGERPVAAVDPTVHVVTQAVECRLKVGIHGISSYSGSKRVW
jgi:hypothetical protein